MVHEMEVIALEDDVDAATACEELSNKCHYDEFAEQYVGETFTCLSRMAFGEKLLEVAEKMHKGGLSIEAGHEEKDLEGAEDNGEHDGEHEPMEMIGFKEDGHAHAEESAATHHGSAAVASVMLLVFLKEMTV